MQEFVAGVVDDVVDSVDVESIVVSVSVLCGVLGNVVNVVPVDEDVVTSTVVVVEAVVVVEVVLLKTGKIKSTG